MLTPEQIETAARNVCKALGLDPAQHLAEQIEIMRHFDVASIERDRALQGVVEPEGGSVYYEQDGLKWLLVQGNPPQFVRVEAEEPEEPDEEEPTDPEEPSEEVILFDDFRSYASIKDLVEDGQAPTTGKPWCDSFPKIGNQWGVRQLYANGDIAVKQETGDKTHKLTPNGLALRCSKVGTNQWVGGCIYSLRSKTFTYGDISCRMRFNSFGPGMHFSVCTFAKSGAHPPEDDLVEVIGSNSYYKDGPFVPLVFFNSHAAGGDIEWHDVPDDFFAQWHVYRMLWTKDRITWFIDGKQYRSLTNQTNEPMALGLFFEAGHNGDEDFPGRINSKTPAMCEAEIDWVKVLKV